MKHIRIALTSLSLLASTAFAETTLTFWHPMGGNDEVVLKKLTADYTRAHPDIKINLLFVPFAELQKKVSLAIPAGQGPDMFLGVHDGIGINSSSNLVLPVDSYIKKSDYLASTIDAVSFKGKLWGFPQSYETTTLIYNPKLVKTPPRTVEQLISTAKKFTKDSSYGFIYDIANFYYSYAWLSAVSEKPLFSDTGEFQVGVNEFTGLLNQLKTFQTSGIMPKEPSHDQAMALFKQGKAAMVITGPWGIAGFENDGVPFEMAPLPKVNGKSPKAFMGVKLYYISSQSKNAKASADFLKFLTSAGSEAYWATETGMLPANKLSYNNADVKKNKTVLGFSKQAKNAIPMGKAAEFGQIWDPAKEAVERVLFGNQAPSAAAQGLVDRVQKAIQK
ncbi:sugar ABC transporter substrate-binding protein [Deinococcus roseus]|uniref:Maltose ABC transporter substrate-binding protein n=1 Tax=Deinococcus roseus TaxID=392414 RepID=A0ABQ2DCW1_9DEIO|nr:extracellular solute-binding protein [Deinococcus roseus]GGJ53634.1 maltose ABC transporter substrate-binding protein [Deinococcus roseus]